MGLSLREVVQLKMENKMLANKTINTLLILILTLGLTACSEDDNEGSDGDSSGDGGDSSVTRLSLGQSVSGALADNNAQYSFSVDSGASYSVVLTPTTSSDDPDLLIFSSEDQMNDYWDIADANGGEDSAEAMNARIAKSDLSPGETDQAAFTAGHSDDYFAMVSGPNPTNFSIVVNAESEGFGCGDECVERADANEQVNSFSPAADSTVTDLSTSLSISLDDSVSSSLPSMMVEIFQMPSDRDDCRIDWPGLRCGNLNAQDSFDLMIGESVISGTATVDGNTVNFTFAEDFPAGYVFVVHIFADGGNETFKTWWTFKT